MKISNIIKHFAHIMIHKYWVLHYCIMCGELFRGIKHDISKLSPIEFIESAKYYTGYNSPIHESKIKNGYSKAYLHHMGHNDHHYEYWIDSFDFGGQAIRMPFHANVELICDYIGAAKAYEKDNFTFEMEYDWWLNKKEKSPRFAMHDLTKDFIDIVLLMCMNSELKYYSKPELYTNVTLDSYIHYEILNRKTLRKIYNEITEKGDY